MSKDQDTSKAYNFLQNILALKRLTAKMLQRRQEFKEDLATLQRIIQELYAAIHSDKKVG